MKGSTVGEVVIVEWESPAQGSMLAVCASADSALILESRIVAKWGAGFVSIVIRREPVRGAADVQSINII